MEAFASDLYDFLQTLLMLFQLLKGKWLLAELRSVALLNRKKEKN